MNKTISIALAGFSFVVEENAYIRLNDYLQALRNSLEVEEREEVMYDIEIRIAEIFRENLGKREVVVDADVDKVIAQIGTPEAIGEQEEEYYSNQQKSENTYQKKNKYIFRDPENKKIAGVCAGLAHYIGMDVSLMRILWVIIFLLTGFFPIGVLYIIFWLLVPEAGTASDFLRMKGKPIDFENIKEESIRFANESSQKIGNFYKDNKTTFSQAGNDIWTGIRKILGFVLGFLAFVFVLVAILGSLGILGVFGNTHYPNFIMDDQMTYAVLGIFLVIMAILVAISSSLSIKSFSPKTAIKNWGYGILSLFILLIGLVSYYGVEMSRKQIVYTGSNVQEENISINAPAGVIELDLNKVNIPQNFTAYGRDIFSDKKRVFEKDRPSIYVTRKIEVQNPYLVVKKKANGYNQPIQMNVPIEVKNGMILLPNYIAYSYSQRFRDYDVSYELIVPENVEVRDRSNGKLNLESWDDIEYDDNDLDDTIINHRYPSQKPKDTI